MDRQYLLSLSLSLSPSPTNAKFEDEFDNNNVWDKLYLFGDRELLVSEKERKNEERKNVIIRGWRKEESLRQVI